MQKVISDIYTPQIISTKISKIQDVISIKWGDILHHTTKHPWQRHPDGKKRTMS
jgi:hypothetical protein